MRTRTAAKLAKLNAHKTQLRYAMMQPPALSLSAPIKLDHDNHCRLQRTPVKLCFPLIWQKLVPEYSFQLDWTNNIAHGPTRKHLDRSHTSDQSSMWYQCPQHWQQYLEIINTVQVELRKKGSCLQTYLLQDPREKHKAIQTRHHELL